MATSHSTVPSSAGHIAESETLSKPSFVQRLKSVLGAKQLNKKSDSPPTLPYRQLFSYATKRDLAFMLVSIPAAAAHGVIFPLFTIIFGSVIDALGSSETDKILNDVGSKAKWFLILGAIAFVTSFLQVRFQIVFSNRVANRLRQLYFRSLMIQEYAWYDQNDGGELTSRVTTDVLLIQAGIGEKLTTAVQFLVACFAGFVIAFIHSWKLTLIILAIAPLLAIGGALFGKLAAESTSESQKSYGDAGAVASEVLSLIRTVTAYNGQESEARRYEKLLQKAYRSGVRRSAFSGLALGFTNAVIFFAFAAAFAFGAGQVRSGNLGAGDIVVTFFSVFIAALSFGQAAPSFNAFTAAQGAAPRVYDVIQRQSDIDPLEDDKGQILENMKGEITFRDVQFNYLTRVIDKDGSAKVRPYVLDRFNLKVSPGSGHALVGSSGCGKSTTVRLIERFYDVQEGQVLIDGVDIRALNVRWLRSQIGYVGQMPTLFMLSIRENIALGAPLERSVVESTGKVIFERRKVTEADIISAAQKANAHDFIMKLPEKYDTMLGERGAMLSGGQKQRVCIARALIRNPKILLLDESTSALDAQSERIVQDALEHAAEGRTTVTIAHRLSTVKNADRISVIENGSVAESGNHEELIRIEDGAYRKLVDYQNVHAEMEKEDLEIDIEKPLGLGFEGPTKSISVSKSGVGHGVIEEESEPPAVDPGVVRRTFRMSLPDMPFILLGMVGAAVAGACFPSLAIAFTTVIDVILKDNSEDDVRFWAWIFTLIGVLSFFGDLLQHLMLGISGERLTRKLRSMAFRSLLRQDIGFFDSKQNSVGHLTTRLSTEATLVKGIAGGTLGGCAMVASTLITGFVIAFTSCWRVALVVMVIFPFMALSEAANIKMLSGFDADSNKKFAKAGAIASEAVDNFDTVTAIGVQDVFIDLYSKELEIPLRNGKRSALSSGLSYGVAEGLAQILWAISFWVGSIFVRNQQCDFAGLLKAITGLLFAGSALGQASLFLPDFGKSRVAATELFRMLDRTSAIDPKSEEGKSVFENQLEGSVSASEARFEYPSRPDVAVLRGLSFDIMPGQTFALVGQSGCGKSTIVSVIERFYDVRSGIVRIDGTNVQEYNVSNLRSQIGIVSQEPDLFHRSVRENIAYGLSQEDGTPVTDEMIIEAAKAANAHDFIVELPAGYDTDVGARGSKLSGGQRQRVAIARSLVRAPRVLLLDEATSALDAVSERTVQNALDAASVGRTTIAIAHRLSTIKDADVIGVMEKGKIVEKGTHDELLRKGGVYTELVRNQISRTTTNGS